MNKYRNKYFYTLVELLMAMAIFAIISVIMMRFFNSAQQIWSKASQRNVMYADARVALDMMTLELQGALYDNKLGNANNAAGVYPFWFEYKDLADNTFFNNPYTYNAGDAVQQATYNKAFATQLNFVSVTPYKPHANASDICEVKYIYLPVRSSTDPDYPTGKWDILPGPYTLKGGTLIRACTGNLKADGTTSNVTAGLYNFPLLPNAPSSASRVYDIFKNGSSENYSQIIDGIVDMKITCYTLVWNGTLFELKSYNPMYNNGQCVKNGVVLNLGTTPPTDPTLTNEDIPDTANIGTIITGSPFPVAVKIDLYMLAEKDLREWLAVLNNGNAAQAKMIKGERMRCFSKIIYLSSGK